MKQPEEMTPEMQAAFQAAVQRALRFALDGAEMTAEKQIAFIAALQFMPDCPEKVAALDGLAKIWMDQMVGSLREQATLCRAFAGEGRAMDIWRKDELNL